MHVRGELGEEDQAPKMFREGAFSLLHSSEVPDELVDSKRRVGVLGYGEIDGRFELLVGGGDAG